MVTQYYWPEDFSAGVYMTELAEGLHDRGHEVEVLTGFPSYPQGRILRPYRGQIFKTEEHNGVRLVRTWFYPSPRSSGALSRGASAAPSPPRSCPGGDRRTSSPIPSPFMGMAALHCARRFHAPPSST
jgi:hypothetical protein